MTTFKEYLVESAKPSKKQSIVHLEKMKPAEALELLSSIANETSMHWKDLKLKLKVDGLGARFGKDAHGHFFFESSRSGIIQTSGAFSSYTAGKNSSELSIVRAKHYDELYEVLHKSKLWKSLPNDTKVIVELLYNPMAEESELGLKFVNIHYDKSKLGSELTIVPLKVEVASNGEQHPQEEKIIDKLLKQSTTKIKIINPQIGTQHTLDVSAALSPLKLLPNNAKELVNSLKHGDKAKKLELTAILDVIKDQLASQVLAHSQAMLNHLDSNIGQDMEGVVIEWNGKKYKVTTAAFKKLLKK
jgi:hypothetical protein